MRDLLPDIPDVGERDLLPDIPDQYDSQEKISIGETPSLMNRFFDMFDDPAKEKAKASNSIVYSEMLGVKPSLAYDMHDQISEQVRNKVKDEEILLKRHGYMGAAWEGSKDSIAGMVLRQQQENGFTSAEFKEELVYGLSKMIADFPIYYLGGILGKAKNSGVALTAMTEMGGAMGLHSGVRKTLMDAYAKGEDRSWNTFMDRLKGSVVATAEGYAIGAGTGLAKVKTPGSAPVKFASEVATMTGLQSAFDGQVPTAKDFIMTGITLGVFHVGSKVVRSPKEIGTKLKEVYKDTGVTPKEIQDALGSNPREADVLTAIDNYVAEVKKDMPVDDTKVENKVEQGATSQEKGQKEGQVGTETQVGLPDAEANRILEKQGMETIEAKGKTVLTNEDRAKIAGEVESGTIDPLREAQKIINQIAYDEPVNATNEKVNEGIRYEFQKTDKTLTEVQNRINEGDTSPELQELANQLRVKLNTLGQANEEIGRILGSQLADRANKQETYSPETTLFELRQKGVVTTQEMIDKYYKLAEEVEKATKAKEALDDIARTKSVNKTVEIIKNEEGLKERKQRRTVKKEDLDADFDKLINAFAKEHGSAFSANPFADPARFKFLMDLTKNRVQKGMVVAEDIVDSIHTSFKNVGVNISKRDIMDGISRYGIDKSKTKSQLSQDISEVKKQLYLLSTLEDVEAGKPLPKTGGKKIPDSERVKELKIKVREAMREAGILDDTARDKFIKLKEKQIAEYERRIKEKDFAPVEKPTREISDEEAKVNVRLEEIKKKYMGAKEKDLRDNASRKEKVWDFTTQVGYLYKNFMSSFDFSKYRQAIGATLSHPIKMGKTITTDIQALKSAEGAFRMAEEIRNDPEFESAQKSGLNLLSSKKEELMPSRWAENVPVLRGFARSFNLGLDRVRLEHFKVLKKNNFKDTPLTDADLETMGRFVNQWTGKGTWKGQENTFETARKFLWAPNLFLSRLQILTGGAAWGASNKMKLVIAKEYARALTSIAAIYSLATIAGWEIGDDPVSSDFGKLIHGNTRLDPMGGLNQTIVLLARSWTEEKTTSRGETYNITGNVPYGKDDIYDVWGNFLRGKFTPILGDIVTYKMGKDITGKEPGEFTGFKEEVFVPMPLSFGSVYELLLEEGMPAGLALSMLAILGANTAVYNQ